MKKKIIICIIAAAVLIAAILAILSGRTQEKEISSGAKLVFGRVQEMKETESTDIVVQQSKCENEIRWESREDENIGY